MKIENQKVQKHLSSIFYLVKNAILWKMDAFTDCDFCIFSHFWSNLFQKLNHMMCFLIFQCFNIKLYNSFKWKLNIRNISFWFFILLKMPFCDIFESDFHITIRFLGDKLACLTYWKTNLMKKWIPNSLCSISMSWNLMIFD